MTRIDRTALWSVFALGVGWMVVMWARSPGVQLDDELAHAYISIDAWRHPAALLDVWGRPGNTAAYVLPARLGGLEGRRVAAILMTALTAVLATGMAGRFHVRARWLVALCFFFQPWIAGVGFQSLTQIPFSLALAGGGLAWMGGRWGLAGLCFGLLPLIRHEGIALAGAWVPFALVRREWRSALLSIAPIALYNVVFLALYGRLASGNLFDAVPNTVYGSGSWWHFVPLLAAGVGLPVLMLGLLGLNPAARERDETGRAPFGRTLLYFTPYALYFLLHTILFRFGLFASGGYGVFLLPLAPAAAVLAARGGEWGYASLQRACVARFSPDGARRAARVTAALVLGAVVGLGLAVAPTPLDPLHAAQAEAAAWVAAHVNEGPGGTARPVAADHIAFWLAYQAISPTLERPSSFDPAALPPGGLLVWDSKYAPAHEFPLETLADGRWRELKRFGRVEESTAAIVYRREDR